MPLANWPIEQGGAVPGAPVTGVVWNVDMTPMTPLFAAFSVSTNGNNTLVAAVAGKKIRVLAVFVLAAGTTLTRFQSGAGGTALTGQMSLVANTGYVLPFNPAGWFETTAGALLNLELTAAVSADGCLTYVTI